MNLCAEQCVDLDGVRTIEMRADALTKFKGSAFGAVVRTGMYTLKGEKSELADRATLRQFGTVPRHKVSAVKPVTERVFFYFICHQIEGISFRGT